MTTEKLSSFQRYAPLLAPMAFGVVVTAIAFVTPLLRALLHVTPR